MDFGWRSNPEAELRETRPKAGPSLSATAEISYPGANQLLESTKSSQESRTLVTGRARAEPPPGNPGRARIRATLLGPLVTGQERPQHRCSPCCPRAGQGEGLCAPPPHPVSPRRVSDSTQLLRPGASGSPHSMPDFSLWGR